jgi:hypothetical protein
MTEVAGRIIIDGKTIEWNKHSILELTILEFSYENRMIRIHIGSELNESRIQDIISAYKQGHDEGFSIGKEHLKGELKRLIGIWN